MPINCIFDPRGTDDLGKNIELIDPTHPLLSWVQNEFEEMEGALQPTCALKLGCLSSGQPPGLYGFAVHEWSFLGTRREQKLIFRAARVGNDESLDEINSEALINRASQEGSSWPNAKNLIEDFDAYLEAVSKCENAIFKDFGRLAEDFEADNENRCNVQEESARRFAERRIRNFEQRIENFQINGNERMIPATRGLITKEKADVGVKLGRILDRRKTDTSIRVLCIGVVLVE
jgi:hypothetical protein